jgi:hypothetical protein
MWSRIYYMVERPSSLVFPGKIILIIACGAAYT